VGDGCQTPRWDPEALTEVHRGVTSPEQCEQVAVKVLKRAISAEETKLNAKKLAAEAACLAQFNHPNVVRLVGLVLSESEPPKIVLERCTDGDLKKLVSGKR
jgi:serine/threonine protein kinase